MLCAFLSLLFTFYSCDNRSEEALKKLGEMNISYNAESFLESAENGNTAAIRSVKILLDAGADVHALDREEKTALMRAKQNNNAEIERMLRNAGATR